MKIDAEEILRRWDKLDTDKATWKTHWQEIADYMIPRKASVVAQTAPGAKRTSKLFDGTAIRALRIFANGLYGHMTSPSAPWFELTVKDPALKAVGRVKEWLRATSQAMRDAINSSNFGMASHEVYSDLGGFGTGCLYLEPGERTSLSFRAFDMGRVCIAEDREGRIDTVLRLEDFTARQCVQAWGKRCSDEILKALEKEPYRAFEVIHAVFPRDDFDQGKRDRENMPWASFYVEREKKNILAEGGYTEFPYMVPRWEKDSGELYGRSCGMDALPDTKMINVMKRDGLRGLQKRNDPPLFMSDENKMSHTRTAPGSIVFYRSGGEMPKAMQFSGDYQATVDATDRIQRSILEAFYADLFLLLAQKPDNAMTATEVLARLEEKLILLGPALGRLQQEFYDPMLSRVFWILYRGGMIGEVPPELVGAGLQVEYISKLALAMRQFETTAMGKTMQFIAPILQIDPSVIDNFDLDGACRGAAERFGAPVEFIRSEEQVRRLRRDRAAAQAQAEEEQKQLIQADMGVKALPGLTKQVEQGSILATMAGRA